MNKKQFTTMYVFAGNEHLAKDVGQIPYQLAKIYGYNSTIAGSYFTDQEGYDTDKFLKVDKIKLIKWSFGLTGCMYILRNARKIDILNLYHTNRRVWTHALLYKLLNPKGKLYVKLDCGLETCDKIDLDKDYRYYFIKCLNLSDLITVESIIAKERLQKYDLSGKIKIVPNGFSSVGYKKVWAEEKQKYILSVGNLSHNPKGTDILIKAFHKSKCYEYGWRLILAGHMNDEFKYFYDSYLEKYTELKNCIIYKGFIKDRVEINNLYRKVEIFALPSYNESFSLAACEALANGCYLILSDRVSPYKELTCDGKYGSIVRAGDVKALTSAIKSSTESYRMNLVDETVEYALKNFSWEKIIPKIHFEIGNLI